MSPITHPMIDSFLLGFIAACSFVGGLFFLRFWKATQELLFLAFAAFFVIQGSNEVVVLSLSRPNEGSVGLFLLRLVSVLIVLGAILWKNSKRS
ncbi:MAG TPA: DUF5985 family protein [Acidobacteriaceae bacterium]|jgi:uncharacterized membrane protein HdeD (DUF308 family)